MASRRYANRLQAQIHCSSTGQEMHLPRGILARHSCQEIQGPHPHRVLQAAGAAKDLACIAREPRRVCGWGPQAHAPADISFNGAEADECMVIWPRCHLKGVTSREPWAEVGNLDEVLGICNLACTACPPRGCQAFAFLPQVIGGGGLITCPSVRRKLQHLVDGKVWCVRNDNPS